MSLSRVFALLEAATVVGLAALSLWLALPQTAWAHDCSGPDDCAVLPPNVDIGTGIAAGAAGGAAGWVYFRRRRREADKPCDELRQEVQQGESRIKDLEAQLEAANKDLEDTPVDPNAKPPGDGPTWIA